VNSALSNRDCWACRNTPRTSSRAGEGADRHRAGGNVPVSEIAAQELARKIPEREFSSMFYLNAPDISRSVNISGLLLEP